ncbi:hypothetical protein GUITHDRAFT_113944 [Guillardia theta CCMP2712]|uniref:Cap-specific mRNA (nucleoside-2'-O-)-methyltransferase 2 n=1 Tax=Guillardia theta (strain CCMP2712) TaxID=905079 RepID=L1IV30_GUITC|nr:hypothetical protein GUITHDRAFT_113944 [Guillardia theta CCMP2712]EKX39952.1 hypothetical protein GUITHDRAFT_113944 [Guillardia theta CCMP2712]|eukprot:XP_005826932.1 hypothetical protein GUITHDRAFT_113944 [Guillardia theta CCMP2712]
MHSLVRLFEEQQESMEKILSKFGATGVSGISKVWRMKHVPREDGRWQWRSKGTCEGKAQAKFDKLNEELVECKWKIRREALKRYEELPQAQQGDFQSAWHRHTTSMDPYGLLVNTIRDQYDAEMCSHAWVKMFHISTAYPELISPSNVAVEGTSNSRQLSSLHVCEAPGGFIAALNHLLKTRHKDVTWSWRANTLRSEEEEQDPIAKKVARGEDADLIDHTQEHWDFGADGTGNVLNKDNVRLIRERTLSTLGRVNLVTADGSIDCSTRPEAQEQEVLGLIYSEIVLALGVLARGGGFVIKLFTFYKPETHCLLLLLCSCFAEVSLVKPPASKQGNSEVYAVCRGFRGLQQGQEEDEDQLQELMEGVCPSPFPPDKLLLPPSCFPAEWMEDVVYRASEMFSALQMAVVSSNVKVWDCGGCYGLDAFKDYRLYNRRRTRLADALCKRMFSRQDQRLVKRDRLLGKRSERSEEEATTQQLLGLPIKFGSSKVRRRT